MDAAADFRPEEILAVVARHQVSFVVIGGLAAIAWGSPHVTSDIDIAPDRTAPNLERLSAALDELDARVWTPAVPEGVAFGHDALSLADVGVRNLVTRFGRLDISFLPSGTQGYDDLHRDAERLDLLGVVVEVASLADVIRSKEAAGRDKDRLVLPALRRLLEEG